MQCWIFSNLLGDVGVFLNMQQKSVDGTDDSMFDDALFIKQSSLLNYRLRRMLAGAHNRKV